MILKLLIFRSCRDRNIWFSGPLRLIAFSIYTLSDLGVLSNLIGSLSLANEHYSPPTEWIMRKPNKNRAYFWIKHTFDSHWFERCLRTIILDCHEVFSKSNYRFSMFKDSVNSFANSRMLCTACTFSEHELRGQLNRFLMVSFWNVVEITSCVYTKTIILLNLGE